MARIKIDTKMSDMFMVMSDGNPGALTALLELFQNTARVDPDNFMREYGSILLLDMFEIYGTDIYILWNDICDRDIVNTIALIRAVQMGIISIELLKDICSRRDGSGKSMINVDEVYSKVSGQLSNFNRKIEE